MVFGVIISVVLTISRTVRPFVNAHTVFTRVSAMALFKFLVFQMRRLFAWRRLLFEGRAV